MPLTQPHYPATVDPLGRGLTVLITSKSGPQSSWMAFATWYSVHKNLPLAETALSVPRSGAGDGHRWRHRCGIKTELHKDRGAANRLFGAAAFLTRQPVLAVEAGLVCVRAMADQTLKVINASVVASADGALFLNTDRGTTQQTIDLLEAAGGDEMMAIKAIMGRPVKIPELVRSCKSDEFCTFTAVDGVYPVGTEPPFKIAHQLCDSETTLNGHRVLQLWQNMAGVWDVVK